MVTTNVLLLQAMIGLSLIIAASAVFVFVLVGLMIKVLVQSKVKRHTKIAVAAVVLTVTGLIVGGLAYIIYGINHSERLIN